MVFGPISAVARAGSRIISNALSKVIATSPVSKVPQKVIASKAGAPALQSRLAGNVPVLPASTPVGAKSVTRIIGSSARQSTTRRVLTNPATILTASLGGGLAFDALSGEGGSTAGATIGGGLGSLTPGGRIKKIANPVLTTVAGAIAGNEGANIAEAQDLGASRQDTGAEFATGSILGGGVDESPLDQATSTDQSPTVRRKSTKKRSPAKRKSSRSRPRRMASRSKMRHQPGCGCVKCKVVKCKNPGKLDTIKNTCKKRGFPLKAMRAALKSPNTPPHLKAGMRKALRKRGVRC